MILVKVGGIEPHSRVVAQGLIPYCDRFLRLFFVVSISMIVMNRAPAIIITPQGMKSK